jgi:hypothetical protein
MKKLLLIISVFTIVIAWQSCQYEWIEEEPIVVPDTVSFTADIIPIFNTGCNASVCHGAGGEAPELTPENAYTSLFAENTIDVATPENSVLYKKVNTGGSMNKYSQPGDPELILKWIQQGALNN